MFKIRFNGVDNPSFIRIKAVNFTAFSPYSSGYGPKKFIVDVVIVPPANKPITEVGRELGTWLSGNRFGTSPLVFSDDSRITYDAMINVDTELSDMLVYGTATLEFLVPSGVGYTANKSVATSSRVATINYAGSADTYPIISYVPKSNLTNTSVVFTASNGGKVHLKGNFSANSTYVIDCDKKVVKVNGTTDLKLIQLATDWFKLPANSETRITNSQEGAFTVYYAEKYI